MRFLDPREDLAGDDADAARRHRRRQPVAQILVEAAQNFIAAIDQRHVGAEAVEDRGELDGDIAAARDDDAARQFLQMECLVRGDDMLDARQFRVDVRMAAGRNQNGFRRDGPPRFRQAEPRWGRQASRVRRRSSTLNFASVAR